jgi:hypothetical protein
MAKTIEDYMNDPRLLEDTSPWPVREVHAARLKIQDETAGMTTRERAEYSQKKIADFFGGTPPRLVDLSGQGKLKPRTPEAVGK